MADNRIKQLYLKQGQSIWQDDIARDMLDQRQHWRRRSRTSAFAG